MITYRKTCILNHDVKENIHEKLPTCDTIRNTAKKQKSSEVNNSFIQITVTSSQKGKKEWNSDSFQQQDCKKRWLRLGTNGETDFPVYSPKLGSFSNGWSGWQWQAKSDLRNYDCFAIIHLVVQCCRSTLKLDWCAKLNTEHWRFTVVRWSRHQNRKCSNLAFVLHRRARNCP